MYYMSKIQDTVRIPPYKFEDPLDDVAIQTLNDEYNGVLDKKLGLMVAVTSIDEIDGVLIMGDGAAYHHVTFNAIFYKPEQQEIVEGEVIEIAEFGAFVRIGPMDGLVHVSQVTDDYINYDFKRGALLGKESNKSLVFTVNVYWVKYVLPPQPLADPTEANALLLLSSSFNPIPTVDDDK